ncbi:MAG: malectin domain-containing carbohydrate-binding protein [Microscillaceae bacterium]|jgi:hypothetical protein|nr:malectin domain-containing carbohydrate-binding protein [Microscillaceae bacterium]
MYIINYHHFKKRFSGIAWLMYSVVLATLLATPMTGFAQSLQLSQTLLEFEHFVSQTATTQSVTLSTSDNSVPASINLSVPTYTPSGTSWLTAPSNPVPLGNLNFTFNPTGLRPGRYTATLTVSAGGYTSANLTVILNVGARVNFQRRLLTDPDVNSAGGVSGDGLTPPNGWIRDSGHSKGTRNYQFQGDGTLNYGWAIGSTPTNITTDGQIIQVTCPTDRPLNYTQRSAIIMRTGTTGGTSRNWNIDVQTAQLYEVTVTVGAADDNLALNTNNVNTLSIEGFAAIPLPNPPNAAQGPFIGTGNDCEITRLKTFTTVVRVTADNTLSITTPTPNSATTYQQPTTWIASVILKPVANKMTFHTSITNPGTNDDPISVLKIEKNFGDANFTQPISVRPNQKQLASPLPTSIPNNNTGYGIYLTENEPWLSLTVATTALTFPTTPTPPPLPSVIARMDIPPFGDPASTNAALRQVNLINFNIAGLPQGVYQTTLTASDPNGNYPDATLLIELTINEPKLNFGASSITLPSINFGGTSANQNATLIPSAGSPTGVALSKTAGADWLILPSVPSPLPASPTGANLSFSFDTDDLAPGTYSASVFATVDNYVGDTLVFNLTVNPFTLTATPNPINFTPATQGGGDITTGLTIGLGSGSGSPTILLTKLDNTALWLDIPLTATVGVAATLTARLGGLAPGTYTTSVRASATGFASIDVPVTLVVNPKLDWDHPTAWEFKINFQRNNTLNATPGYSRDIGAAYPSSPVLGNFGWLNPATTPPTPATNTSNSNGNGNVTTPQYAVLLNSYNFLQQRVFGSQQWKIRLNNGKYNVLVGVGDPTVIDGVHRININGVNVIDNFVQTSGNTNRVALATIDVTNNEMIIDANDGGRDTKINFINIGLASNVPDNIAPTIQVKFTGTTTAPTNKDYKDQVLVDINYQDAGSAGLAIKQFTLNGATQNYTGSLLINEIGEYTLTAYAEDAATPTPNTSTTPEYKFKVVRIPSNNGKLAVFNLDRFPSNEDLSFSRIQHDGKVGSNPVNPLAPPKANNGGPDPVGHERVKVRLRNSGAANLRIDNFVFSNNNLWKIEKLSEANFNAATQLPLTLTPGQFVDITVQFIASYTGTGPTDGPPGGRVLFDCDGDGLTTIRTGVLHEFLTIVSNDDDSPQTVLNLHGLWMRSDEGCNEPTVNEIFETFNLRTATGFDDRKRAYNDSPPSVPASSIIPTGDEIFSPNFKVADPNKPVYMRHITALHSCCTAVVRTYYGKPGQKGGTEITFQMRDDGQTILPRRNAGGAPAERSFFPVESSTTNGVFNFTFVEASTDRNLNLVSGLPVVGVRIYKARDSQGNIIPNAYLMAMDYPSATANWDYNDNVFYVENIKPELGTAYSSILIPSVSEIKFNNSLVNPSAPVPTVVALNNSGQVGLDPNTIIRSFEIVGDDFEDFTATFGSALPITTIAGASANISVTFTPKTIGVKNAELLIYYNAGNSRLNTNSPIRIPLFGVAESSCIVQRDLAPANATTLIRRIKSAALTSDAVNVNGELWESDLPFRKGSIKLDNLDDVTTQIRDTDNDALYRSYLSSLTNLKGWRYDIPVTNGDYVVRLHFAENAFTNPGERINNISLENVVRIPGLDILAEAGFKTALTKELDVTVTDGILNIEFTPTVNRPALSAVEIFAFQQNNTFDLAWDGAQPSSSCNTPTAATVKLVSVPSGGPDPNPANFEFKIGKFGEYSANRTFNLEAGTYTFYARQVGTDCEVSKELIILENNNITFNLATNNVSCNSNTDGNARVTVNAPDNINNYLIIWNDNPNLTAPNVNTLAEGANYKVTLTRIADGCTKTQFFNIGKNSGCPLRINSGGDTYISTNGFVFIADQFSNSGSIFTNSLDQVGGTPDGTLYSSERFGNTFSYNIPVANGNYAIRLHFAEIRNDIDEGERRFNVDIEGVRVLSNYDMVAEVGNLVADVYTFNTLVSDNSLTIALNRVAGTAKISAIEVIPINVDNVPPQLVGNISNRQVPQNQAFSFAFGETIFSDPGDILTYQARQVIGLDLFDLPSWISFNPTTRTFNTFPDLNIPIGTVVQVRITATDTDSQSATEDFNITVVAGNVLETIVITQNSNDLIPGTKNRQIIGIELDAGSSTTLVAQEFVFNSIGTTTAANVENARLYYTGNDSDFDLTNQFGTDVTNVSSTYSIVGNRTLASGINYFWLVYDIKNTALVGENFDAQCIKVFVSGEEYDATDPAPEGTRKVVNLTQVAGQACDFQGNYLSATKAIQIPQQLTLEFWLNPRQNVASEKWIIGEQNGMRITQVGNQLRFFISDNGVPRGPATVNLNGVATTGDAWNHVAAVYDGTTLNLYLNGIAGTPFTYAGENDDEDGAFFFAGTGIVAQQNELALDEVRFWSIPLTANQIRMNRHLVLTGLEPNLVAYWQFNEPNTATEGRDLVGDNYAERSNLLADNWIEANQPIGQGISVSQNVNAAGLVNFGSANVSITFGTNNPNGEVVVTRLFNLTPFEAVLDDLSTPPPASLSDGRLKTNDYWVINNYGNQTLSPMMVTYVVENALFDIAAGDPKALILHKRPSNSTDSWVNDFEGFSLGGSSGSRTVSFINITGFSQTIVSNGAPFNPVLLPVTLGNFGGKRLDNQQVELYWNTFSETDNKGFEVQKGFDLQNFTTIGFVDGNGTTNTRRDYKFIDKDALAGAYYRLKQIDNDGDFEYSRVIFITGGNSETIVVYPNPTVSTIGFTASTELRKLKTVQYELVKPTGEKLLSGRGSLTDIEEAINQQLSNINSGVYIIKLIMPTETKTLRLIKQ